MALTPDERRFLKGIYRECDPRPLQPGDPRYQPIYEYPGCEDPLARLRTYIEYADSESLNLFSGFRGSGKTTELFRLKAALEDEGYVVLYANALDYVNPAVPIDISDLLVTLAGAFSECLERSKIPMASEGYWARFWNFLSKTEVNVKELGFKTEVGI